MNHIISGMRNKVVRTGFFVFLFFWMKMENGAGAGGHAEIHQMSQPRQPFILTKSKLVSVHEKTL